MTTAIEAGTTVKVAAHRSEPGKGLSYPAMTVELVDPCETEGWDVIDVRLPDGSDGSIYSFSVEREPTTDDDACTCEPGNASLCLRCERIAENQDIGF